MWEEHIQNQVLFKIAVRGQGYSFCCLSLTNVPI
jgi:hypothetical protein